jgi:hypothetical protein
LAPYAEWRQAFENFAAGDGEPGNVNSKYRLDANSLNLLGL